MLITAPTSTFGWWLAFFSPNQNAVFYNNDLKSMDDKSPNKDLFLWVFMETVHGIQEIVVDSFQNFHYFPASSASR
ncbi:hypothetical protein ANCCAN_24331 [Ancylostoma caninum]|uniref:Uncharacterized protein n=1 Tax=Ancylostoma caninum TaxID=29170 RepID=A0A368FCN4_ANCCA|nr:hypothetical protein ANCCAN_24331 [Ancylostoma caninum]